MNDPIISKSVKLNKESWSDSTNVNVIKGATNANCQKKPATQNCLICAKSRRPTDAWTTCPRKWRQKVTDWEGPREYIQKDEGKNIREGCGKSKWKFKMAFAMKGGGLEGVSSATYLFWKIIFVKNHLESFPDCENVFCT